MARPLRLEFSGKTRAGSGLTLQHETKGCYAGRMARPLRLEFSGAVYHVTSRGDRREEIFLNDADRIDWLQAHSGVRSNITTQDEKMLRLAYG